MGADPRPGSRILGLGDLGINGMPISIGKLSLYVAGAGIRPESTVPICLDTGTDTQKFLEDPLYLGLRQKRRPMAELDEFMEEFMREMAANFPHLLIQFEDFATDKAFGYLERFRGRYPLFNDDIQGTGAVVLSGFLNAAKIASAASGRALADHKILFLGAGSAGVGVAMQLMSFFKLQGLSDEEARGRIYLVDSQGLIYDGRGPMAEHKKCTYPPPPSFHPRALTLTCHACSLLAQGLRGPADDGPDADRAARAADGAARALDDQGRVLAAGDRGDGRAERAPDRVPALEPRAAVRVRVPRGRRVVARERAVRVRLAVPRDGV